MSSDLSRAAVVCIGETMGQFVPMSGGVLDATAFQLYQAGAESNVAVGLAGLGLHARWVSRLGDDALGQRILRSLTERGVDISLVEQDASRPTGIFLKDPAGEARRVVYYRGGSAASAIARPDVDRALASVPEVLHTSGILAALSESCDDALEYALARAGELGVTTSFDVNYRPTLWAGAERAAERLAAFASRCDIVFIGVDEAEALWGLSDPRRIADRLAGARHVIVKNGGTEATLVSATGTVVVPALRAAVFEAVGAGDAFVAGWLAAMLFGLDDTTRLRCGHLAARAALLSDQDFGDPLPIDALVRQACDESLWQPRVGRSE